MVWSKPSARSRPRHHRLRRFPCPALEKDLDTNPLERLNKDIKRRTDVVGVFPNPAAPPRLPARCSSKPPMNGRSPTNATCPKPPWRCSRPTPNPTRTLHRQPHSRHGENRRASGERPAPLTPRHGAQPISAYLMRWLRTKYKRLRTITKAAACWQRVTSRQPSSSRTGHGRTVPGGQDDKSPVTGDCHAGICEGRRVRPAPATQQLCWAAKRSVR
jgi:Transposase, Mutator family